MAVASDDPLRIDALPPTQVSTKAVKTEREKKEIERLKSKHADYREFEDRWRFFLQSYEGGHDYIHGGHLFSHTRENKQDFDDRVKRAVYENYAQPLTDFVPEFIFAKPPERKPSQELAADFEAFSNNVDRADGEVNAYFQTVAELARLFGFVFVQCDKPAVPDGVNPKALSVAKAKALGLNDPYFVTVTPLEVYDWATDQFGQLIYVKRVQDVTEPTGFGTFQSLTRYHEWTINAVRVTDVQEGSEGSEDAIVRTDERVNEWSRIPFVRFVHRKSKTWRDLGSSFLADIAYTNRKVFNLSSLIDEFLYRQCFNMLAMENATTLPTRMAQEGDSGTSNVLEYPHGGKAPEYVSPPAQPAEFIQSERQHCIEAMYRLAAQDLVNEIWASGDAQKQSFGRTIPVIARLADSLQCGEVQLWSLWALLKGKEWKGKIAYRDDYSVTNFMDLLLQMTSIFNEIRIVSPTFIRAEWKRLIREIDGRLEPDVVQKIHAEIDHIKDEDLVEMYRASIDRKASLAAPATANRMQGEMQQRLGSDRRISLKTGNKAATKEFVPDRNKRSTQPRRSRSA